jgi:phage terminase large subunit-like protein
MSEIEVADNIALEDLIKRVDYVKMGENYYPTKFALKFINFIKLVNGETKEENTSPLFHYEILDAIYHHKNVLVVSFRGSAKTAVTAEYFILYLAVFGYLDGFGDVSVGMYVGDTMENGVKNLRSNLEFRYNNSEFLQQFIPTARFTDVEWEFTNAEGHQLCFRGFGASPLSLDTKLPKIDGTFTTIGECKVGDKILSASGKETTIEIKSEVFNRPVYEIKLLDGRTLEVSDNHINKVIHKCRNYSKYKDSNYRYEEKELTTQELLTLPLKVTRKNEYTLFIPTPKAIEYPTKDLTVDPYTLGLLLGDGQLKADGSCNLTAEQKDMEFYKTVIPHTLGSDYTDLRYNNVHNLSIKGISQDIKNLGLRGVHTYHKFIPEMYKRSSKEQRLELLRGLMDSDGTVDASNKVSKCTFVSTSKQLAEDVVEVVRTLGGYCSIKRNKQNKNSLGNADYYRVIIHLNEYIFKLPRKLNKQKVDKDNHKNTKVAITSITRIEDKPTQCIGVSDKEHLFLAGDYVVTHNTGVRGFKKYGQRPQVSLLDDLMSDKSAESKTIIKDIENVIYKAVRQAMHPTKRKVIWIGTPFNKKDPLYKAAGSKAWVTKAYPICEKFPCTKKEFVGAWEDRFPYEAVKAEYDMLRANGRIDAFNQELMLRVLSDDDRLVLDEDIIWYKRSDVLDNLHLYHTYITTDFATSENEKADYSVISVWALDWTGRFHWIDGVVKRQDMAINIDDMFRFVELYNPLSTGVEISGQQKGFVSWLRREMSNRHVYFMIASDKTSGEEGLRPNTSKLTRFNIALPLFKQRKIAFPEELKDSAAIMEFIDELTSVTPSGFKSLHDDCADTISQLPLIDYFKPIDPKYLSPEDTQPKQSTGKNYFFTEPEEEYKSSYIV